MTTEVPDYLVFRSELGKYAVLKEDVNYKFYWQLGQFSNLTNSTATLTDIEKAMPNFSVFDSTFWKGQYAAIESGVTLQGNRRRLVIEKGADNGYTVAHLYDINSGTHWTNYSYHVNEDGSHLWNGWESDMTSIDARGSSYDMDAILKSGRHYGFYETNSETLGTPYKYGVTLNAAALILSFCNGNDGYGFQIAFVSSSYTPFMRRMSRGTISPWSTGYLPLDGTAALTGSSLELFGGMGYITIDEEHASMRSRNERNSDLNARYLTVLNSVGSEDVKTAVRLTDRVFGINNHYILFGEHNKEMLTEAKKELPLADGFTAKYGCHYYKNADGDVVVHFAVNTSEVKNADTRYLIATLPDGYRPGDIVFDTCSGFVDNSFSKPRHAIVIVNNTGTIEVACNEGWDGVAGTIVFKAEN